jgi:putative ABC transport system permease protein
VIPGGRQFGNNLRSWLRWRNAADDVREEMRLHVDLRAADLEACGTPPGEARRIAEREVGDPSRVRAEVERLAATTDRRAAWTQPFDELRADTVLALRLFRRSPGFSLVAVLTIGLGLGANAAIFALVNRVYFEPLPFDPQGNLVRVREFRQAPDGARLMGDGSRRTADAIADRPDLFASSVPVVGTHRALITGEGPLHVQATRVGPGFASVTQMRPILGRGFTSDEEAVGGGAGAALISHRLWRSAFGGRSSVVGERMRLDDQSFEIVGVLPPAVHIPYGSDVWFPSRFGESERSVFILARLAPGVTLAQVNAELGPVGERLNQMYPDVMRGLGVTAVPAREYFAGDDGQVALALMGAVGFLLLIGCANVGLLLTTRFAARRREVAVRAALGCGRVRLVRQFVTEALLLFVAGGAAGLLLASWITDGLVVFLPEALATHVGLEGLSLTWGVVGAAGVVAVAAGLLFGSIAALRATRADLQAVMKESGRGSTGGSRGTLRALASAEAALAVVLLTTAGMMAAAFESLARRDLGFEPAGVLTIQAGMESSRYASGAGRLAFIDRFTERLRALPGVQAVGMTTVNPLCCGNWGMRVSVEGQPLLSTDNQLAVEHQLVTPGYVEAMKMRLLRGRAFTPDDREGREPVALIDALAAERFWPGEDPIGKRMKRGSLETPGPWITIVGVVAPVHDEGEYTEAWYLPYLQHATGPSSALLHFMVRSDDPAALIAAVRAAGAEIDPALALHDMVTLEAIQAERLDPNRLAAFVTTIFAGAGLLLASLGLYGVLSFVLASDTREIGVRVALGARRSSIAALIVARGVKVVGWGFVSGVVIASVAGAALGQLVPDARLAPSILTAAVAALAAAALVATLIPAIRAMRLDPLDALRHD